MNENLKLALAGLAGAAVGATASFVVVKKILEKKYEQELIDEMAKAREHYEKRSAAVIVNHEQPFATPDEAVAALIQPYQDTPVGDPRPNVSEVIKEIQAADRNVFEDEPPVDEYDTGTDAAWAIPDFVYEEEVKKRSSLAPYIITDEEFNESDEHEKFSLTYYEGDKVLADDHDEPVDDIEGSVGRENLLRFGHGSNDSRIVYVRNEKRKVDFEIAQHDGSFAEIIGLEEFNRKGRG